MKFSVTISVVCVLFLAISSRTTSSTLAEEEKFSSSSLEIDGIEISDPGARLFLRELEKLGEESLKKIKSDFYSGASDQVSCLGIEAIIGLGRKLIRSVKALREVFFGVCFTFRLANHRVCSGLADIESPILFYVFTRTKLSVREMASVLLGNQCMGSGHNLRKSKLNWQVKLPINQATAPGDRSQETHELFSNLIHSGGVGVVGPQPRDSDNQGDVRARTVLRTRIGAGSAQGNKKEEHGHEGGDVTRFLQLTDIHFDSLYRPGAEIYCDDKILCCRATGDQDWSENGSDDKRGDSSSSAGVAGFWGEVNGRCDAPLRLAVDTLTQVNESYFAVNSDSSKLFDFVIWTGDATPHDVWNTSREEVGDASRTWTLRLKEFLPSELVVYPVLGNHEGHPVDQFSPPEITGDLSSQWIYDELFEQWRDWLPESGEEDFKRGGFYARNQTDKLRVVVLNTNLCARANFWQMYNPQDPTGQLAWLVEQLDGAERSGQHVLIVGHIPPSSECTTTWLHNYLRILVRYQAIIKGSFFGHTHKDEVRLYYANKTSEAELSAPVVVGFVGGSITTYGNVNPCYKIYSMEEETGLLLDVDTYYFNMTAANEAQGSQAPVWLKEKSPREQFALRDMSPGEWGRLLERSKTDSRLLEDYYHRMHRYSDAKNWSPQCNRKCQKDLRSGIVVTDVVSYPESGLA